jgi:S1-C subfamily serine protease
VVKLLISVFVVLFMLGAAPANQSAVQTATAPVSTPATLPKHNDINFELVRQIVCGDPEADRFGTGTAVIIADDIAMTAAHVVGVKCWDLRTRKEIQVYYVDYERDFALIRFPTVPNQPVMPYDCSGFTPGSGYSAIGFARGERLVLNRLIATAEVSPPGTFIAGKPSSGLRLLRGEVIPGMSGGPVLNELGVIVGMNSATDNRGIGLVRDLKDTVLCDASRNRAPSGPISDIN